MKFRITAIVECLPGEDTPEVGDVSLLNRDITVTEVTPFLSAEDAMREIAAGWPHRPLSEINSIVDRWKASQ